MCLTISERVGFLSYEGLHDGCPDISVAHFKKYEEYVAASNRSTGVLLAQNKVLTSVLWNDAVGEVNHAIVASKIMCDWFGVDYRRVERLAETAKQESLHTVRFFNCLPASDACSRNPSASFRFFRDEVD